MKKIDQYLTRQFVVTYLFIQGMIIALVCLVDFVEKIDDFLDRQIAWEDIIFVYYANFIPYYGNLFMPICVFLAVIFFTSRMANRAEIIPLLSAGVSFYRLFVPYVVVAVALMGLSFYLKSYSVPLSAKKRILFEYDLQEKKRITSNRNIHKKVAPDTYVYFNYYNEDRKEGHNFTLEQIEDGDISTKLHATRIKWIDSTETWKLSRVTQREINGTEESVRSYAQLDTSFLLGPDDLFIIEHKEQTLRLGELYKYIRLEEMRGSDILRELYLERHRRWAYPLAILILTTIGFAMSSRKSRGGTALQIGVGLFLCFFYIMLLTAGEAISGGSYPPWMAVWLPNVLFLSLGVYLLRIAPK